MIQRIYRTVFLMFLVAGAVRTFAQVAPSSDAGVWLVHPTLDETTLVEEGDDITFDFDGDLGYGISFNHFWTDAVSTEVALQKYTAGMSLSVNDDPTVNIGEIDVTSVTAMAQYHFNRAGRFSPYAGAGVAWIVGEFDPNLGLDPDGESIDLESEVTWTAAAGAHFNVTDRFAIVGEVKYLSWEAIEEGGDEDDAISVNPLTFSAGVKLRF